MRKVLTSERTKTVGAGRRTRSATSGESSGERAKTKDVLCVVRRAGLRVIFAKSTSALTTSARDETRLRAEGHAHPQVLVHAEVAHEPAEQDVVCAEGAGASCQPSRTSSLESPRTTATYRLRAGRRETGP